MDIKVSGFDFDIMLEENDGELFAYSSLLNLSIKMIRSLPRVDYMDSKSFVINSALIGEEDQIDLFIKKCEFLGLEVSQDA